MMKLEKFKEKDHKRIGILIFTIVCISLVSGAILYRTFAIFEVKTSQNVIKGTVQAPGNIYFAFYVNDGTEDKIQKEMPTKNYVLDEDKSYCGVNGERDNKIKVTLTDEYGIYVTGVTTSRTKCNLYFVSGAFILGKPIKAITSGEGLYKVTHEDISGTIKDDGFKETEFRYAGKDPNNYVTFNDEKWRIIGLVNVMTSDDKVEQRVKIVKNESIGQVNWENLKTTDWANSYFQKVLNTGEYFNKQGSYSENGFTSTSKSMIEQIWWNNGTVSSTDIGELVTNWYIHERESMDTEKRSVGLIYPSDYNYAVASTVEDRAFCLNTTTYKWSNDRCDRCNERCVQNDWIKKESPIWTLTAMANNNGVVIRNDNGIVDYNFSESLSNSDVFPTLYLKPSIKIISGTGGKDDAYVIAETDKIFLE